MASEVEVEPEIMIDITRGGGVKLGLIFGGSPRLGLQLRLRSSFRLRQRLNLRGLQLRLRLRLGPRSLLILRCGHASGIEPWPYR